MPEWFYKKLNENLSFYPDDTDNQVLVAYKLAFISAFEFLSKPENVARIPVVENLIGHATACCQFPHKDHCDLEQALKPFKKECSDDL